MANKRKAYTPFSTSSEAGVTAAPVEGYIDVTQDVRPTIDTGFVDSQGTWIGHVTSDIEFKGFQKDDAIANNATMIVFSDANNFVNMNGYDMLQLALKSSNTGNLAVEAVMGPDSLSFKNLTPIIANDPIKIVDATGTGVESAMNSTVAITTADAWMIVTISQQRLTGYGPMSFKVTNQQSAESNFEFAYRRLVL